MIARDRSRMAETPRGSVHESPVRGQRTRPTLKTVAPSLQYIPENSCEANAGSGIAPRFQANLNSCSGLL